MSVARVGRIGAVVALIAAYLALTAPLLAADSESTEVVAEAGAWYGTSTTSALGNVTVASGDLPVGAGPQGEDKRSYLVLRLSEKATSASITLRRSEQSGSAYGTPGNVLACIVTEEFVPENGGDLADAPAADCGQEPVVGVAGDDGYTFDLTPIVTRWAAGDPNYGIALAADNSQPLPWQLAFTVSLDEVVGTASLGDATAAPGPSPSVSSAAADAKGDDVIEALPPPLDATVPFDPLATAPVPEVVAPAADALGRGGPPAPSASTSALPAQRARSSLPALPINPAVWLSFPAAAGFLYLIARSFSAGAEPRSTLQRLLES